MKAVVGNLVEVMFLLVAIVVEGEVEVEFVDVVVVHGWWWWWMMGRRWCWWYMGGRGGGGGGEGGGGGDKWGGRCGSAGGRWVCWGRGGGQVEVERMLINNINCCITNIFLVMTFISNSLMVAEICLRINVYSFKQKLQWDL